MFRISVCFALVLVCFGQDKAEPKYEMDNYVVGFLRKGPKWTAEQTPATQKIQEGHLANILHMGETGKLIVAGPFTDNSNVRGILIFKTSIEDARQMTEADPAVKAGRLVLELHPWFAAKGLRVAPPK